MLTRHAQNLFVSVAFAIASSAVVAFGEAQQLDRASRDEVIQVLDEVDRINRAYVAERQRPDSEFLESMERQLAMRREMLRLQERVLQLVGPAGELSQSTRNIIAFGTNEVARLESNIAVNREHREKNGAEPRPACYRVASKFDNLPIPDEPMQGKQEIENRRLWILSCLKTMPYHYPAAFARARAIEPGIEFDANNRELDVLRDTGVISQAFLDVGLTATGGTGMPLPPSGSLDASAQAGVSPRLADGNRPTNPLDPGADSPAQVPAATKDAMQQEGALSRTRRGIGNVVTIALAIAFALLVLGVVATIIRGVGRKLSHANQERRARSEFSTSDGQSPNQGANEKGSAAPR